MSQNNMRQGCCEPDICSICGTNINTEDVYFARPGMNLVYMDKVYSYNKATACPILTTIPADTCWITELTVGERHMQECSCGGHGHGPGSGPGRGHGNGCGCGGNQCGCGCECTIGSDAVFTVSRSYVLVDAIELAEGELTAEDVTVDGVGIDTLTQNGNRYIATTGNLIMQVNRKRCQDAGLASKNLLLVTCAGPWTVRGTIVIEGSVNTGGKTCCFEARFTTPEAGLSVNGESTFAVPKLALPCSVNGVSPTIEFSFTGLVYLLNPTITATVDNGVVILTLAGALAAQPQLNVEVVRRTLFRIEASEGVMPCDGTQAAFAIDTAGDDAVYDERCEKIEGCTAGENAGNGEITGPFGCSSCSW